MNTFRLNKTFQCQTFRDQVKCLEYYISIHPEIYLQNIKLCLSLSVVAVKSVCIVRHFSISHLDLFKAD